MKFVETPLSGAFLIELDKLEDSRGFFARFFCAQEFEAHGLKPTVAQCNVSFNHRQGTLRGMHFQVPPAAETKLVRCTQGAIYDVIVDLRPNSPTYRSHFAVELSQQNYRALYIPEGFAHGFQTLTDNAEVFYQMGEFYTPGCQRGIRYSDPILAIAWPLPISEISGNDAELPLLEAVLVEALS